MKKVINYYVTTDKSNEAMKQIEILSGEINFNRSHIRLITYLMFVLGYSIYRISSRQATITELMDLRGQSDDKRYKTLEKRIEELEKNVNKE